MLPRLCSVVTYREEQDSTAPVVIRVVFEPDEGDETVLAELSFEIPAEAVMPPGDEFLMREARFYLENSPIMLPSEGKVKVRAIRGDDLIKLGSLRIGLLPSADPDDEPSQDA
jgi:hypothetical protein